MGEHKRVTSTEANRNFAGVLRRVRKGQEVVVTSHGEPVAKVVPIDEDVRANEKRQRAWEKHMARVKRQPIRVIGPWTRDELYER